MPQNLKKIGMLAAAVLISQVILSKYLYPLIGRETQTLFSISPASGIGGAQVGDKIVGYLSGFIPFDLTSLPVLVGIYIGAFVLIWVGFWLYEQRYVTLWQGKNLTQRIFAILLYGHIVLYAILWALKSSVPGIGVNLLIGLAVNLLLVSAIVTLSASKLKFPRI